MEEREEAEPRGRWWRRGRRGKGKGRLTGESAQLSFLTGGGLGLCFPGRGFTINRWAAKYHPPRPVLPFPRRISRFPALALAAFDVSRAAIEPEGIRIQKTHSAAKQSGTSILGFPSLARKSDGCARPLGCWVGRVEFTRINKAGGSAVRDLPEGCRKCAAPPAAALSRVRRYTVHKHPSSYIGQCHFPTLGGKRHNESGT